MGHCPHQSLATLQAGSSDVRQLDSTHSSLSVAKVMVLLGDQWGLVQEVNEGGTSRDLGGRSMHHVMSHVTREATSHDQSMAEHYIVC